MIAGGVVALGSRAGRTTSGGIEPALPVATSASMTQASMRKVRAAVRSAGWPARRLQTIDEAPLNIETWHGRIAYQSHEMRRHSARAKSECAHRFTGAEYAGLGCRICRGRCPTGRPIRRSNRSASCPPATPKEERRASRRVSHSASASASRAQYNRAATINLPPLSPASPHASPQATPHTPRT
ncbi:hypothetical protein PsYK624_140340 [Phanerochaete sordida]|uniref:Uncharacterized protein n=1 Tax=Phanerochaete sordida TaxID=48140 RepID=A0A9P3LL11_9APHY|nr:hypothetical protein PsYK624_140340 [Phanerochaete sordida]